LHDYIYLSQRPASETDELYLLRGRFYSDIDLSWNLSKYPAAVDDGPNEFLPPFSREREFAILVGDTAGRSPEGRFNFAKLAASSRKICIATLGAAASVAFLTLVLILECHFGRPFLDSDRAEISKRHIHNLDIPHFNDLRIIRKCDCQLLAIAYWIIQLWYPQV